MERLDRADIVFYSGLHLEAKLAEVFEKMGKSIVTVPVTDLIPRDELHVVGSGEATYDPHVWFDVSMWSDATESVRRTLVEVDPTHADDYNARAEAYQEKLTALDEYVRAEANTIPEDKRVLITAHDAFGYFAAAYGFEVKGLQGVSTATEAGAGDVQSLADFIVDNRDSGGLRGKLGVAAHRARAAGSGPLQGLRRADRRIALFRCHGRSRHLRRHLSRHGAP